MEAFVLAGGKSSRMGQDKGLMPFRNKPMITYILEKIRALSLPVKIVANSDAYNQFGCKVVKDDILGKGPMGGLLAAFHNTEADYVCLFACDMPFISTEAIQKLIAGIGESEAAVASVQKRLNPLFAIYKTTLCGNITERIAKNELKMLRFVESIKYKEVMMDNLVVRNAALFVNLNSMDDLMKNADTEIRPGQQSL